MRLRALPTTALGEAWNLHVPATTALAGLGAAAEKELRVILGSHASKECKHDEHTTR